MSTTTLAFVLLTAPLPEPPPSPVIAAVAAGVFGGGMTPRLVGLGDPGGPFQQQRWEQNQRLSDRLGDSLALEQLGRR